jgi:hypothetical protein
LVQCLFLLYSLFLCVAYSCAVVDKKDHTTGAIQRFYLGSKMWEKEQQKKQKTNRREENELEP